jgi:hypothetical protein
MPLAARVLPQCLISHDDVEWCNGNHIVARYV